MEGGGKIRSWALPAGIRVKAALRGLKRRLEGVARMRILPTRSLPRGIDLFVDLQHDLEGFRPDLVLDVGANVGDSSAACLTEFPEARIYAFEPVGDTYAQLCQRFAEEPRVQCFPLAIGAEPTTGTITKSEFSVLSSLSPTALVAKTAISGTESVEIETLDRFTEAHGIDRVGCLKIDTEGYDLNVLKGAERLLREGAVDLIEVEVGMHSDNTTHVPFEELKRHLEERGYALFGLYEQTPEWTLGRPQLRRANVAFVSAPVMAAHDSGPPAGLLVP